MARTVGRRQARTTTAPAGQSIGAFARVSKSHALAVPSVNKAEPLTSRKRKADGRLARRTVSPAPSSSSNSSSDDDEADPAPAKRQCRRPDPQARLPLANARPSVKGKPPAKTTPSRAQSAHKLGGSTAIAKSRRHEKTVQTKLDGIIHSKQCSKKKAHHSDSPLPPYLADLVRLNKVFLETVAMHIAHTASNAPMDIGTLIPDISRTWGRRHVTVDDVGRCIAIQALAQDDAPSPFVLSDYGRGRVCVELAPGCDGASIDEARLQRQFEHNLGALCAQRATDHMADVDIPLASLSLDDLPQATITKMATGSMTNQVLAKGQRALSELKKGLAAKQQGKEARQQNEPMLNPDGTKMDLLDRLRHKQLSRANEALPPTRPQLERRAALNRVMDVAATISMLSLSNPLSLPRQAFTMMAILEKLRDSLRVPVSREEGMACVRLVAMEVAPEWLKIVTIGGRENVVIQRSGQPVNRVIQERVEKLLAA